MVRVLWIGNLLKTVPGGKQVFLNLLSKKGISVLATTAALALGLGLGMSPSLTAQDKQEAKKKDWKDKQEYDLYDAFQKAATPAAKLSALEKWKQAYPNSDFAQDREEVFMSTYQALMDWRKVIDTAQDILKTNPNQVQALAATLDALSKVQPQTPADLDLREKTANYMWDNLDTIYAPGNKPANLKAEDWAKIKPQMKPYLVQTLLSVIAARKDDARAMNDLSALLKKDPNQPQVSYALATSILAVAKEQKKPEEQQRALYHWARAAGYDGPNAYSAADRQKLMSSLSNAYKAFHGSTDGLDQLVATAKNNPFPPADFKIASTVDLAEAKAKAEEADEAAHPMKTFWVKNLKEPILMDDTFFDMHVKDAALPGGVNGVDKFKGTIVSMKPENRPKEIELAIENPGVADAKLVFESPLPGKMEVGETLSFEGIATSYTKEPYEITFMVDPKQLDGWTGKNAAPARKAAPKGAKKAAPKK